MALSITNEEADTLTRKFAQMATHGNISEAVVIAMREAIERRLSNETPIQTAARLREQFGVTLSAQARQPLPQSVYDEMSGN